MSALAFSAFAGETGGKPLPKCCVPELKGAKTISDKSIYQAEAVWTTDSKEKLTLSTLGGKPQVIVMFFASCQYACPILVNDLKRIEEALPENLRDKVGFTLVSFDGERDTPEVLHDFREKLSLPERSWTLLTAGPDDVLELAALLGVKFKKEASGQFAHSNIITLLNKEGEIVRQLAGLNQDVEEFARAVASLARP